MKTFKDILRRIDEVQIPDDAKEINFKMRSKKFKDLHTNNTVATGDVAGNKADVYSGNTKKRGGKRPADYDEGEDEAVNESDKSCDCEGECDCDDEDDDEEEDMDEAQAVQWAVTFTKASKGAKDNRTVRVTASSEQEAIKKAKSKAPAGYKATYVKPEDGKGMQLEELSPTEARAKERIVKGMKKNKDKLMKRYGDDWKSVMHATATKLAAQAESVEQDGVELVEDYNDVINFYVDECSDMADEICELVSTLVYDHEAYVDATTQPSFNNAQAGKKFYSAKEIYRTLQDVRDRILSCCSSQQVSGQTNSTMESVEIDEAVKVLDDRYINNHGHAVKPSVKKQPGNWMFTSKKMGAVDYKDTKNVFDVRGTYGDAVKAAKNWAKQNGHSYIYVMEQIEPLEEEYKAGKVKTKDGKSINISKQDADALNKLFKQLSGQNKKNMSETIFRSVDEYNEVLGFAKEAA